MTSNIKDVSDFLSVLNADSADELISYTTPTRRAELVNSLVATSIQR